MSAALLAVLLASAAGASITGAGGGDPVFAVAQGAAAYAVETDAAATGGRVIVRRLGLDGGVRWQDRWGQGRGEEPVGAAVGAGEELTVFGGDSSGCWAAQWSPDGRLLWNADLQYGSSCQARAVVADGDGGVYALGTTTVGEGFAPTVWRLDRRGAVLWTDRDARPVSRYAYALTLAASGDGVSVTTAVSGPRGWVFGSYDLDASGRRR